MRHSTSLPVELWHQIFRLATLDHRMPELSSGQAVSPFDDEINADGRSIALAESWGWRIQRVKDTKRALSMVCKNWRATTIEYLFEHLTLNFRSPGYKFPNGPPPLSLKGASGPLTKVLSISVAFEPSHQPERSMRSYQPFISLLPFYPNLAALCILIFHCPLNLLRPIVEKCGSSMHHLMVHHSTMGCRRHD